MPSVKIYVLNLDRHAERLAEMSRQLDAQNVDWTRFSAVDGAAISDAELDRLVARQGPIPRMTRAARACTAGHFSIFYDFLASSHDYALVLEDDTVLSSKFAQTLRALLAHDLPDLLNLNRLLIKAGKKRVAVGRHPVVVEGRFRAYPLLAQHYGTGGYLISRNGAKCVLQSYPKPDMPIDHILFNPNISALFDRMEIAQLFPALVQPGGAFETSIQNETVEGAKTFKSRLRRARSEVAILPRLLLMLAVRRATLRELDFAE